MADLVKRLRNTSGHIIQSEAADAIEELTAALRTIRNYCDAPHWSPKRKHDVRKTAAAILSKYGASNG